MTPSTDGPVLLDGGLATTLQDAGHLQPFAPVEPLLRENPTAVRAAHRAFVNAGAQVVLTATFRSVPDGAGCDTIHTALQAADLPDAARFLSVGPSATTAPWGPLVEAAQHCDGVVLETFTDPDALASACQVFQGCPGPLVASLVALPGGPRLADLWPALRRAGATVVGVNCSAPTDLHEACWGLDPGVPLWLKLGPDAFDAEVARWWNRADFLGGCCGVTPSMLQHATSRLRRRTIGGTGPR